MLSVRTLLPCLRQCVNHTISSHKLLINQSLKSCTSGASIISQLHRSFASEAPDPNQTRIYYGTLASRMKAVKIFSLTTSLTGIAAQPILLEQGMKMGGAGMAVALCSVAGFFTFVTPLLLHFITKKYVTEIHYDRKTGEYTATTISILLYKIQTKFRPSDVTVPEVPGMFTSFKVGEKPLFVDPTLFEETDHYVKIMGYDKPIDFKIDLSEVKEFGAGAELLFGNIKKRVVFLDGSKTWTLKDFIKWMHDSILTERPELFIQNDSVRPGILVLVNDTDWELLGELDYELQPNDNVLFISTLHGG